MKSGLKTEVAELEEEVDKVRSKIDEQKLEEDINELLVTRIQEVLAPIENNPRIQKVGKIDVSKYKETAFDTYGKTVIKIRAVQVISDFAKKAYKSGNGIKVPGSTAGYSKYATTKDHAQLKVGDFGFCNPPGSELLC